VLLAAVMDSELRQKVAEEYNLRKTQIQMNIKLAIRKRDKLAAKRCCLFFSIPPSFFFIFQQQQGDDAPRRARRCLNARAGALRGEEIGSPTESAPLLYYSFVLQLFTTAFCSRQQQEGDDATRERADYLMRELLLEEELANPTVQKRYSVYLLY